MGFVNQIIQILKFCHKKDGGEKAVAGVICFARGKAKEEYRK